jgi:hypothetical protein
MNSASRISSEDQLGGSGHPVRLTVVNGLLLEVASLADVATAAGPKGPVSQRLQPVDSTGREPAAWGGQQSTDFGLALGVVAAAYRNLSNSLGTPAVLFLLAR